MTAEQLDAILTAVNQTNLFACMTLFVISLLSLIELIRLIIVLRRSVKGRMDNVR